MDQITIQTIIEGGILITLIFLGGRLIGVLKGAADSLDDINETLKSINKTVGGGNNPPDHPPPTG